MRKSFIFLILFCFIATPVMAQSDLAEELKAMREEMLGMQKRLSELESKVASQDEQIAEQKTAKEAYAQRIRELEEQLTQKQVNQPAASSAAAKWTPEIGAVADIVYTQNSAKEDEEGADRISVRELELVLGSNVDPYSRLDATVSFSDTEDPSLEEAYLTRFGLPFETTARLGKFKPKVGKALLAHRDSLDTVDEPLVIQRYFGVEGFNKTGLDFTKLLELPWPVTHQLSFGVLEGGNGEDGMAFGETRRAPTAYSHLKNYLDITDTTGFELGFSHMAGSRDEDSAFEVQVLAADATLRHQFNATQNMKIQGEVFNLNRKDSFIDVEEEDEFGDPITVRHSLDGNLWGTYGLVDFKILPQWSTGFRYDYVQPVPEDSPLDDNQNADQAYTGYLTFHQSEFARWRLQFTHTDSATIKDDNAVYLQGTFAIGDHKHKIQ